MEIVTDRNDRHDVNRSRLRASGASASLAEARLETLRAEAGARRDRRNGFSPACSAVSAVIVVLALVVSGLPGLSASEGSRTVIAQSAPLPELTEPVNDFANVVDPENEAAIDKMIRALKAASGDVVVVATVPNIDGYGDIREYANRLAENHGKGVGDKGKDNGLVIVFALEERQLWVEVGYDLEQWITDGFAGETFRRVMAPAFRAGDYGTGLRAGTTRIVARIAQGRNVTLPEVPLPREVQAPADSPTSFVVMLLVFFAILMISRIGRRRRPGIRNWGHGGWSDWSSGVGPFGGGWSGGFGGGGGGRGGGGGFGGGFGGFGGGRTGGGGGGGSW
jgi:uncharacterized protein